MLKKGYHEELSKRSNGTNRLGVEGRELGLAHPPRSGTVLGPFGHVLDIVCFPFFGRVEDSSFSSIIPWAAPPLRLL